VIPAMAMVTVPEEVVDESVPVVFVFTTRASFPVEGASFACFAAAAEADLQVTTQHFPMYIKLTGGAGILTQGRRRLEAYVSALLAGFVERVAGSGPTPRSHRGSCPYPPPSRVFLVHAPSSRRLRRWGEGDLVGLWWIAPVQGCLILPKIVKSQNNH
jgi:hypothetical protein